MPKLREDPDMTRRQFETELERISVMLERRLHDLFGGYKLTHSSYFRNPSVVAALGHFLYRRKLPDWADDHRGYKDVVAKDGDEEGEVNSGSDSVFITVKN